jgi:hypothetical protein
VNQPIVIDRIAPTRRNPKFTLPLRVSDGSVYEALVADEDEVEPAATLPAANPAQFAELDFVHVNGARVSLYRDPEQPQRYHVAINGKYQPDEATDSLEQARFNFKGVQIEVWDARRSNR